MIHIDLSQERVRNGERLSGKMTWRAEGTKTPRKLEVICRWRIEGKGKDRQEIVGRAEQAELAGRSEVVIPFEFEIPIHGPLTYDGKLLRIIWEVAATADLPMARDEEEVKPFSVTARRWDPNDWVEVEDEEEEDEDEDEEEPKDETV